VGTEQSVEDLKKSTDDFDSHQLKQHNSQNEDRRKIHIFIVFNVLYRHHIVVPYSENNILT
jgi:hypothetical protein